MHGSQCALICAPAKGCGSAAKKSKIWDDHWKVYSVRKAWRQLCHEGEAAARCTGARLMAGMGLPDIVRGKAMKKTFPDASVPCSRDKVNRQFRAAAPNLLWVSDFYFTIVQQTAGG